MSEELRNRGREFAGFLEKLPNEKRDEITARNLEQTEAEYREFEKKFAKGKCYLCNKSFSSFKHETPCIHWLMKPRGFRKNDLPKISSRYGFFQIQSYLRWVANKEKIAANINDLPEEGTGDKLFELTIKYKNLEWAFSCSESDFLGHEKTKHSQHPHYHLQMRVDELQFIKYNDFHLPFSEHDIIHIEAMRIHPEIIKGKFTFGEGMSDILNEDNLENLVNHSRSIDLEEEASIEFSTLAIAEEGQTISGDDLYEIIQEAKEKGVSITSLMDKLPNAQTRTIVSPGKGVVHQAPRKGGKKRK